jgi:hypothetical protein
VIREDSESKQALVWLGGKKRDKEGRLGGRSGSNNKVLA